MADTADTPAQSGSLLDQTKNNAYAAYNSVTSGPVAQNVRDETQKATNEFNTLAASRRTPDKPAATGQPLTHYHSFFSELLSWNNPRASAIAYVSIVSLIFAARYLDIFRYTLKLTWMVLGVTVAAEGVGKFLLNRGLASQLRPRQYYTLSQETLNSAVGDIHELINFFVIESQRILFAENLAASGAVAIAAFFAYFMVKIVPFWGMAIIGTTFAFVAPLIYTSNQELIDQHLHNASEVINSQTAQVREVAQKQAEQISAIGKQYAGDYTGKVQEMLGRTGAPGKPQPVSKESEVSSKEPKFPTTEPKFPVAPTEDPLPSTINNAPLDMPEVPTTKPEDPLILT